MSECCSDLSEPYQPNTDCLATKKKQGKQSRSFCSSWFKDHRWLSFCVSHSKVFCFYCRTATSRGWLTFSTKAENTFTARGFNNWKKAKQKFREHEQSLAHREAMLKYSATQQPSVSAQLNCQVQKDQLQHRQMLLKQLTSLKYLVRQGLAVRGHVEEEGNLHQLLMCRAEDTVGLEKWLSDRTYQSHDIVNELIQLMAHQLLRHLLNEIRQAEWYSVIADETRDASGPEQLGISLRWVDSDYIVNEDLIGLVEVEMTDAATLVETIKDTLIRMHLQLTQCRGQAYDGASNMAGHLSGVSTRIQSEEPSALYVHCMAHCLNLCLQDCGRNCRCVRDALDLASELGSLVRASPKRLALFKHLKDELAPNAPGLKPLCPTRWTVRKQAFDAILKNYTVICNVLDEISTQSNTEASRKASGMLASMEKFATLFGLKLAFLVFSATEQLSRTLQSADINAQEATRAACQAVRFLERQRSDPSFAVFYHGATEAAKDLTEVPTLPRQRQVPKKLEGGAPSHRFLQPDDYFRQQYFEVLDMLIGELNRRFNQDSFQILEEMERVLIESCNGVAIQPSENFKSLYASDLKFDRLVVQLSMLPDLVRTTNEKYQLGIKKVTSIGTLCQLMSVCSLAKTMLSEVDRLLRIYLTVPMTSATAERTFSTLRRVKSYLRSTMTQKRLNHVILLHTHKQRTDDLNLIKVAQDFATVNNRRRAFFGNFL